MGVLENFTIFTEKHQCGSIKKLLHRCFPVNIANFLRATFFIEHLWWLLLDFLHNLLKITVKSFLSIVFLRNYFLVLAAAFLKMTPYNFFAVLSFFEHVRGVSRAPLYIKMESLEKIVNSFRGIFRRESNIEDRPFCVNSEQLKYWTAKNIFLKKLHLRCLAPFWIRLWNC